MTQEMETVEDRHADCDVCGLPRCCGPLHRLAWIEGPVGHPDNPMVLVPAIKPKHDDMLICESCIRQIKRLPFSELRRCRYTEPLPPVQVPRPPGPPEIPESELPF